MSKQTDQIDALDISVFEAIPSQTSDGDRRSLLAIQRITARKHGEFNYLEIGSHLGGSIQSYLLDERCKRIYSIDPRPKQQPDDRSPGYVAYYQDNSSGRMLALLRSIGHGDIAKIECIELDASEIPANGIKDRPEIAFIDGEHTKAAVLSDFCFCEQIVSSAGTIAFHDFGIIYPAILDICRSLRKKHRPFVPLKLEGGVFAIFFDADKIHQDPYLALLYKRNRHFLSKFLMKTQLKRIIPKPALNGLRAIHNTFKKTAEQDAAANADKPRG
jgi:hypothetical protein